MFSPHLIQKISRRDDWNATKRVQHEQIFVTAYDASGASAYGQFEKLIVLWITTFPNVYGNFHKCSLSKQYSEKSHTFIVRHVFCKVTTP